MTDPYVRSYDRLHLSCLDPDMHERTCDYWYAIVNAGTAHTAFRDADRLREWIGARGLTLTDSLPPAVGEWKTFPIAGGYRVATYCDVAAFAAIEGVEQIPVLSNAEWTVAKVTVDADGWRTVHYLNVNYRDDFYPWGRGTTRDNVVAYLAAL